MSRRSLLLVLITVATLALSVTAEASQYPAWGDTGWIYAGKRDCCNEAIGLAQRESALACMNIGGTPAPTRGGVQRRGSCSWESTRDADGNTLFRCYAEASIWCR